MEMLTWLTKRKAKAANVAANTKVKKSNG